MPVTNKLPQDQFALAHERWCGLLCTTCLIVRGFFPITGSDNPASLYPRYGQPLTKLSPEINKSRGQINLLKFLTRLGEGKSVQVNLTP